MTMAGMKRRAGVVDDQRPRIDRPPPPPRRTIAQRLARIQCWARGYHCNSETIGRFRYDVSGICCYCGVVGTGIEPDGE